jgi:4-alpha-glucanotransferase
VHNPLTERRAGLLLHPTSLPGDAGQGVLGVQALRFVDFLAACGFSVWQTLPLGPTHADGSPYQCLSVHAGNTGLICLQELVTRGWLDHAGDNRQTCLVRAREGFRRHAGEEQHRALTRFREAHDAWLLDYARYHAIRERYRGASWYEWPAGLRDREPGALARLDRESASAIEQACFEQFVFFEQWHALRDYARRRGILIFGDIPIYVAHDSADVWSGREYFSIGPEGQPDAVAGVPPDYFSATGQRWGNPLYRWDRMAADGYRWWIERFRSQLDMFDIIRLDHFRGFEKYWEIPAASVTAVDGCWRDGPGEALFLSLEAEFGALPLVAEDLGTITPEVDALRERFGMPGMKIMQFAFDGAADNPYLPRNHTENSVVYTGTHDNDTTLGWYEGLDEAAQQRVYELLGNPRHAMPWALIEAALASTARLAILPMQDVLALGSEHRMNTPGTMNGNWCWRLDWAQVPRELASHLHEMLQRHGRLQS